MGDFSQKLQSNQTIRCRGHIWAAQAFPKRKAVKESADLRESKMSLEDRLAFVEGKKAELAAIFEHNVWEVELHPEKVDWGRVMKARFVLKWTSDRRAKARLVLQGFGDPDLLQGELNTSSPTLARSSRQCLLAIATCSMWKLFISDVSTAFLQGDPQTRILWAKIPKDACQLIGAPPGTLMRLLKPIYGQADAPRQWFVVARRRLISIGYKPHALDQCLYLLHHGQDLISMIGLHVDDLLGGGDENHERYQDAKQRLKAEFTFKHWREQGENETLEFCGCHLTPSETGWLLHQKEYIVKMKPITLANCNQEDRELSPKEARLLRALLGGLQWPATQSAPHLCASVSLLCGEVSQAKVVLQEQCRHWTEIHSTWKTH